MTQAELQKQLHPLMVKALRNDMTAFDIAMVLLGEARGWIGIARGGLELEQQDRAKPKKRHR